MAKDQLTGRIYIVTGGTQGLGKGIALHLAEKGAEGIIICGRNTQNGEASAKEIQQAGCTCEYVQADLTQEADCRHVVRRCDETFGRVHGLVNAAGITDRGSLEDTTAEAWDRMFHTNVRAPFLLTQDVVNIMRREKIGGSIVNIISDTSHGGPPYIMAYSASKGALATLTKNIANALRWEKIRVNGINMGWTYTPHEDMVQKGMGKGDNWLQEAEAQQPFGRLLRPLDIAYLTAYLLSDQAEMMTGAVIDCNQNVIGAWD
ncbi:SDR family oxidoreductase [candidate division KSB3 bacterium]|uniref:SDR family oxidoreductase n=1 Tax=candidate division KSB3 bacterium TaxID=2044937 RepID=A0A9D5JWK1_9BACT|nr:SDR family oxidoreductase [candidate division KSB3 bacterium]MBD3325465.1 SDR family oxidoreductase [candidate division KSB3 bacterium]